MELISNLFRDHAEEIRYYLRGKIGCRETAEDLLQESYIRLCRQAPAGGIEDMRSYLYRVVRNITIDYYRSVARERERRDWRDVSEHVNLSDDAPACEDLVMAQDQLNKLKGALARRSVLCQRIFTLTYIDGLKNREVAEHLGVCQSTVEKNLSNAKAILRRWIKEANTSPEALRCRQEARPAA